ncbi:FG-GAP-like repeat-containing protein [Streptomyces sp. NBC_00316]|uniref:FG-GAP-like repeat-containing protein n=1 Tax=Streptomyces sp. NBC_00316 TaxID=2975710 RepID=UPI002E29420D|nr:FG-GAP-like repeat-containing protein [Streptomyces sp. NBC_00316]
MTHHAVVRRRTTGRRRAALAVLTVLAAGLGSMPAAHADDPVTDITIPATLRTTPGTSSVMSAGTTGFLHASTTPGDYGLDWTTYDGVTRRVEGGDGLGSWDPIEHYGADSDTVALPPKGGVGDVVLRDMASGTSTIVTVPAGERYFTTLGDTVVAIGPSANDGSWSEMHLLRNDNGTTTDRKVTGLPEGATFDTVGRATARGFLTTIMESGSTTVQDGWVDLGTAELTLMPEAHYGQPTVTDRHIILITAKGLHIYEQGKFDAPVRDLPASFDAERIIGVVGDSLIVGRYDPAYGARAYNAAQWRVFARPFDGSAQRELVARAVLDRVVVRPDGGLVIMGGASALDYGFTAITAEGTGEAHAVRLHPIAPVPMTTRRVLMDNGQVSALEYGDKRTAVYTRDLTAASPGYGPRIDRGSLQRPLQNCGDTVESFCPALVATGDGRTVYRSATPEQEGTLSVVDKDGAFPGIQWKTGFSGTWSEDGYYGTVVRAASGNLVLVTGPTTSGVRESHVIDINNGAVVRKEPSAVSALWGNTLWTSSETAVAGKLTMTAKDAHTGAQLTTVTVGAGCTSPIDIQAVGEWLYWRCDTTAHPYQSAGVYNLSTRTNIPLTDVGTAQLGKGVVVTAGATRYDVHSGTAVGQPLEGWSPALDPRTGDIAVQTKTGIRVLRAGLPAASLTSPYSVVTTTADTDSTPVAWRGEWWLSEPAASWTVTFRSKITGKVVATRSGGAATYSVATSWDGHAADGGLLPNGAYTWTLTAQPADGVGAALTKSGTVQVTGGSAVPRDFVKSDGFGDLLAFTSAGVADFRGGTGTGLVDAKVSGSGWTGANTVTSAVPFDDVSGDRCNDVLVRVSSGELRAYKPSCGGALKSSTAYTKVGAGWNVYDVLTSPGDLTGDGRADLLARETSTGYLYLYESAGAGVFKSRVKIGTGWKGYLLAGAGDLNGDGKGDLLARDAAGVLWRYAGTGKGTLAARVKVGGGWQIYNSLVGAGDLSGDGKADLLARDTSGVLWSYKGDGKGLFAARVKVGGGWQMYSRLS